MQTIDPIRFRELMNFIGSNQLMKFYKSREWKYVRLLALKRDNYECQQCKKRGKYSKAQCVHHKKEVRVVPLLALTLDNLESLCNRCHNKEHDRYQHVRKERPFVSEERW